MITLRFNAGTIEVHGVEPTYELPDECVWDKRSACFRGPAVAYAKIVMSLVRRKISYVDDARNYASLELAFDVFREPRPYQLEAINAWQKARFQGLVVLPTGAGKTHVAMMGIERCQRSALVVAPTLDLVRQWHDRLRVTFACPVGVVGGGEHRVEALTVTTYDSAYLHMDDLGNRFGLVIFDECHHLPSGGYRYAAESCLAPFRLGLSATPERSDGAERDYPSLIGDVVYRKDITELTGQYLADYETIRLAIPLKPDERAAYEEAREEYRSFVRNNGIRMSSPSGWGTFIQLASRSRSGRDALAAYHRQRTLSFAAPSKLEYLEHLLWQHRNDRSLIFTQDNASAYAISKRFLVPAITHQTKVSERSNILAGLSEGRFNVIATSRVLNEGVDVPEANVAIIMSGSGSVREHVQRLGRILRKSSGKRATLYELVAAGTAEQFTSERRREHSAYR